MGNFQETFSNKIIFQLCHHLDNYFSTYCLEHNLLQGNFQQFNTDFLIKGMKTTISHHPSVTDPYSRPPVQPHQHQQGQPQEREQAHKQDGQEQNEPTTGQRNTHNILQQKIREKSLETDKDVKSRRNSSKTTLGITNMYQRLQTYI
jgi:hypothetical protein